jgi:hypothetical protein
MLASGGEFGFVLSFLMLASGRRVWLRFVIFVFLFATMALLPIIHGASFSRR